MISVIPGKDKECLVSEVVDTKEGVITCFTFQGEEIEVSDGYHTMSELYDHRRALNVILFKMMYELDKQVRGAYLAEGGRHLIFKSKLHNDGSMFDGYFIVMAITHVGHISYHYNLKYWDDFKIPEVERAPEWDGHTSQDVVDRLLKL